MSLFSRLFKQSRGHTVQLSSSFSSASTRCGNSPLRNKPRYDGANDSVMTSEVNEMRSVLFDDLRRRRPFRLPPHEIHFGVDRAERQPRLEDQQYTTVEKKTRTD